MGCHYLLCHFYIDGIKLYCCAHFSINNMYWTWLHCHWMWNSLLPSVLVFFPFFQNLLFVFLFIFTATTAAKSLQSCLTLCDPIGGSPPGSPVPGILKARTLEWLAISLSNAWEWKVKVKSLSCVQPLATPWTAAYQAPVSMGFSRQKYWSGVPLPSPLPFPRLFYLSKTELLYPPGCCSRLLHKK